MMSRTRGHAHMFAPAPTEAVTRNSLDLSGFSLGDASVFVTVPPNKTDD